MRLPLAILLVSTGLPAFAQSQGAIDRFLAVVEARGCVVDEANNRAILKAAGLSMSEGSRIVSILMSEGRAVPHGDDLRITTGKCS